MRFGYAAVVPVSWYYNDQFHAADFWSVLRRPWEAATKPSAIVAGFRQWPVNAASVDNLEQSSTYSDVCSPQSPNIVSVILNDQNLELARENAMLTRCSLN